MAILVFSLLGKDVNEVCRELKSITEESMRESFNTVCGKTITEKSLIVVTEYIKHTLDRDELYFNDVFPEYYMLSYSL